jgi:hypothetical protein
LSGRLAEHWLGEVSSDVYIGELEMIVQRKSHTGIKAMGIFLFLGATMASLAGVTLIWRGTILDRMWAINAPAYRQLAPFGKTVGIPLLLLGATMAVAGTAWFKRRVWGWRLAVAIIATQVFGDLVNAFMGDLVRGGVGLVIAGALLVYLLRPQVRCAFASGNAPSVR